ncbi:MAG: D-glycero-beta-D-manno-heptose-7-phosphate kinase [Acidobacteria bacterium]|nr:D-glycero-beta-D-manno-heptose-7-phosphate kinase [Acidobacteriota bacterium]
MFILKRQRAAEITAAFAGKRIIVLGDLMLDEFIFGRVRRISPEAPVPVVEVERQTLTLGGAGNVVSNLVALGASPMPLGVVGDDADAERMRFAFQKAGVNLDSLVVDAKRPTTLKTRIIAHNQQVVRADRENCKAIAPEIEEGLLAVFRREMAQADALIVSDYNKGLLTARLLAEVLSLARERELTVCLDPKRRSFAHYQPLTVITPNHQEASEASGITIEDDASLIEAGQQILHSLDCRAALITRGEEGMALFTDDGAVTRIPTVAREVYDVTGAGDTVIATLTLALASGASYVESAVLANHAAGVVVGKLGTATVSRDELLATI